METLEMILVDTSVVIDFLRTADSRLLSVFQAYNAAVCGVTRAEVLHGARSAADITRLTAALDNFAQIPIPDSIWDVVGIHLSGLRSKGISVPFTDVVIASTAIHRDIELWTRDAQFHQIQAVHSRLKLFVEPSP